NTFLLHGELWERARRLLEVGEADPLEAALDALVREGDVVIEGDRVYRRALWEMECRVGRALGERAREASEPLFDAARRPEIDISEEQWGVVELVRTRPLVLLTGLPGAGKTHTQRALV